MNADAILRDYVARRDWFDEVEQRLWTVLESVRKEFHRLNPAISVPKAPECRTKEIGRLFEKVKQHGHSWPFDKVFTLDVDGTATAIVNDLVAGRLTCATPSDVDMVVRILESCADADSLLNDDLKLIDSVPKNYPSGYCAWHIDVYLYVNNEGLQKIWFPVEIQVKTLLHDAWANFGHDDFYKSSQEPPAVSAAILSHLSKLLSAVDLIGQSIREEKLKQYDPEMHLPGGGVENASQILHESSLSVQTLSEILEGAFNRRMSSLELDAIQSQLKAYGFATVRDVANLLRSKKADRIVTDAWTREGFSGECSLFDRLYLAPVAEMFGIEEVIKKLREKYCLTGRRCGMCKRRLINEDDEYMMQCLDRDYGLCQKCASESLKRCKTCDRLGESTICALCTGSPRGRRAARKQGSPTKKRGGANVKRQARQHK